MVRYEKVELMNICMIYDHDGNVVMQKRNKKVWPGVTFPGGHVEKQESLVKSVIREIKEETGLDISNVKLCGVKEWFDDDIRSLVFFYKTNCFTGKLTSSNEGEVFWVPLKNINDYDLASDFEKNLELFLSDDFSELFYAPESDELVKY